jgi:hypothetical protein
MNLETAAQALREQFPGDSIRDLDRRERRIEKFGQVAFGGFAVVVLIGVLALIYTILDRMVFSGEKILVGIIAIIAIVFATLLLAYVFMREDLKDKRKKAGGYKESADQLQTPTSKLLEDKPAEPIPTVIEDTTELLPVNNTRKL